MDFLFFAIAHLFAVLSPGPTFIGLTNFSISHGFKRALPFVVGISIANAILSLISLLGLSEIIFKITFLKIAFYFFSGFYICYFGIKIWSKKPVKEGIEIKKSKAFIEGFSIEISNPKSIIFTTSLIALFVKPDSGIFLQGVAFFWLVFASLFYEVIIIYFFAKFRTFFNKSVEVFNKIFSVLLVFFGARLLFWGIQEFYIHF